MVELLFLILILSTGALLGNEFSIGVFIHPALVRTDHEHFLPAIQVFAASFGKVTPFWMAATLVLHLALLAFSWHWPASFYRPAGVEPYSYLCDVLQRLPTMTNRQIKDIVPKAWAASKKAAATPKAA